MKYYASMAHKSHADLSHALEQAGKLVPVGARYSHYKNPSQLYTVIDHVIMEASDEVGIVYRAEYGGRITFVRSLVSWREEVEHEGQIVPRFSPKN